MLTRAMVVMRGITFICCLAWLFGASSGAVGAKGHTMTSGTPGSASAQSQQSCDDVKAGSPGVGRRFDFDVALPAIQSSVWPNGSVSMAIPLHNAAEQIAIGVKVTEVKAPPGVRVYPDALPISIGNVSPDDIYKIDARFDRLQLGVRHPVIVRGIYQMGGATCKFQVVGFVTPKARDNQPVTATTVQLVKADANTAVYLPAPPPPGPETEFNAIGLLPPMGPPRYFFTTPPDATTLNSTAAFNVPDIGVQALGILPLAPISPNAVVFTRNTIVDTYGGFPPDPSVAGSNANGVAMATANTKVSYSIDNGKSFNTVSLTDPPDPINNPGRNSFFPQDDGGVCCDQVLNYIPKRNLFVWLLQYWPRRIGTDADGHAITGPNRLRIAWATPEAITSNFLYAWTWVDLTSDTLKLGNDWMDYPDLAWSDNFLYVGVDHAIKNTGTAYTQRHLFIRLSLNDMADTNIGYVTGAYMDPTEAGLWQNHIAQSSPNVFYWSAMPDTSTLTVWSWPDSSDTATPHDVPISSYNNSNFKILTPEGIDFNHGPKLTLGATVVDPLLLCPDNSCTGPTRFLYFAFSAGRNGSARPFPYVRVEKIDRDSFTRVSEMDIWNSNFGFTLPTLIWRPGNEQDDVALSLAVGGGGRFANNAVGFLGDHVVYRTTDSDSTQAAYQLDSHDKIIYDDNGNPTYSVRFGDYYSVRNSFGPVTANGRGVGYSTLGYAIKRVVADKKCVDSVCKINERYVQFGRYRELVPPEPPPPPPR